MYDEAKDLRSAQADSQPAVTISHNELLQELDQEYNLPPLEDDDVTVQVIASRYKISPNAARERMQKMVDAGTVMKVDKRGKKGNKIATYVKI